MNPWSAQLVASIKNPDPGIATDVILNVPDDLLQTQRMPALRRYVPELQAQDIEEGIMTCLATGSSLLVKTVALKFVDLADLATVHLPTSAALQRFTDGWPIISIYYKPGLAKASRAGRPDRSNTRQQLVQAIAMTVTRLDLAWSTQEGRAEQEAIVAANRDMEGLLGSVASLFNINTSHYRTSNAPVADYCRTHGPGLLAAHYGLSTPELRELYFNEVARRGPAWVLEDEQEMLAGLIQLASALETQRSGETSRSDSLSRHARRNASTSEAGGAPPRMHKSVRENLVLEKWRQVVNPTFLLKASLRFGLEVAEIFPSRQFLLPLLRAAAATGKLALRKQDVGIDNLLLAGGIVALFENAPVRDRLDEELGRMSCCVRELLQSELGGPAQALDGSSIIRARSGRPSLFEPPI